MRRIFAGALALVATACSLLFPLDEFRSGVAVGDDAATVESADGRTPQRYRDEVLLDAPVLYLRFGEKSGTIAIDETKQHDGTYGEGVVLGAAGAIAGDPDTAVTFDGKLGSAVTLRPGLDFPGTAPFSVEVWVLQTSTPEYAWAVDHQVYGQNRNGWGLNFGAKEISLERWRDDKHTGAGSTLPLTQGKYQHVVATFDGDTTVLYVDGVSSAENNGALSMPPMTSSWNVGGQNCPCTDNSFIGSLDELAIYDKALPASRVLAHFHAAGR